MEKKNCKTCKDNDNGLCDRKGILVEDDDTCNKWQQEKARDWKESMLAAFLRTK